MNNRSREIKRIRRLGLTSVIDWKIFDSATGKFKRFRASLRSMGIVRTINDRYYSSGPMVKALRDMSKEFNEPIIICEAGRGPSGVWFL